MGVRPGVRRSYNAGDTAMLQPTLSAFDDYFQIDTAFTNTGADHRGFVETPAFYLSGGFRSYEIQSVSGTLPFSGLSSGVGARVIAGRRGGERRVLHRQRRTLGDDGERRRPRAGLHARVVLLAGDHRRPDDRAVVSARAVDVQREARHVPELHRALGADVPAALRRLPVPDERHDSLSWGTTTVAAAIEALRVEFEPPRRLRRR